MNKLVMTAGLTTLAAVGLFFAPLMGALFGAFSGWVVGLLFADTIWSTLASLTGRVPTFEMWELGATLGFVGGFFRTNVTKE